MSYPVHLQDTQTYDADAILAATVPPEKKSKKGIGINAKKKPLMELTTPSPKASHVPDITPPKARQGTTKKHAGLFAIKIVYTRAILGFGPRNKHTYLASVTEL